MTAPEVWEAPDVVELEEPVDFDFDEAWAERRAAQKPPKIRLFGKVYSLPNSLPAKLILFAVQARRGGRAADSQVTADEAYDLLSALLREDNLISILNDGLEMDDLPDLLERCQNIYKARQSRKDTPGGNGQAPAVTTGAQTPSTGSA